MGLLSRVKDILFEEEEVTEPINVVKEERRYEPPKVEKPVEERPISRPIQPERKPEPVVDAPRNDFETVSERDLFKSDNTFPFPDFDEDEFNNSVISSRSQQPKQTTNVLEYERKKKSEKRSDYGRFEKTEVREVVEKKRFKPSPIISPVYGILNEDYTIDDIKNREEVVNETLDIDSVRKKAFEPVMEVLDEEPKTTYYEETVTVKIQEPEEEREQKVKTIDELLEDTSDVTIAIDEPDEDDKRTTQDAEVEYDELDDELEELINQPKETKKIEEFEDDDTLENDLFDLIDSMYDSREDGEL